jgi:catechol 2,3-dioxygenase-like lactoylglutathione lyase family enzyme
MITGVDFIALQCTDAEASKKFYEETLGLPLRKQWGDMPAYEFDTDNLTLAVMQSDGFGIKFAPSPAPLEFHVEDFDAAKAELESKGVEFIGDTIDSGVCKQAFFSDPDGNRLGIHHRYEGKG